MVVNTLEYFSIISSESCQKVIAIEQVVLILWPFEKQAKSFSLEKQVKSFSLEMQAKCFLLEIYK